MLSLQLAQCLIDNRALCPGRRSGTNLVMCMLEFNSEKIPSFHSYFRSYLLIFIFIQFLFLKKFLILILIFINEN